MFFARTKAKTSHISNRGEKFILLDYFSKKPLDKSFTES